jgi:hypothetical protein
MSSSLKGVSDEIRATIGFLKFALLNSFGLHANVTSLHWLQLKFVISHGTLITFMRRLVW